VNSETLPDASYVKFTTAPLLAEMELNLDLAALAFE